jgi:beta-mannosidase
VFRRIALDDVDVLITNDTDTSWTLSLFMARRTVTGEILASVSLPVRVPPHGVARRPIGIGLPRDPTRELLTVDGGGPRVLHCFAADERMAFPPAEYDAVVTPVASGYFVRITAVTLLRDLTLRPDRLDPSASSDGSVTTLLPGELVTWHVTAPVRLDPDALVRPPVLRTANPPRGAVACSADPPP